MMKEEVEAEASAFLSIQLVPEPGTLAMLALGVAVLRGRRAANVCTPSDGMADR
jgi:PEP-CTERM motif